MTPSVKLVTPVLNAAEFIHDTVDSVLAQDYPALEYTIVDGGSTDGTVEILDSYASRIQVSSAKDRGQADAIRQGLRGTSCEFVAYLNGDDLLLPGAITRLVAELESDPHAAVAYAAARFVDAAGNDLGPYPTRPFDRAALLRQCFVCQPATLIRRSAYEAIGGIDANLHYAMDYDLWLRLAERYRFRYVEDVLAHSRMHPGSKTLARRADVYREVVLVLRRHAGYVPYEWVAGWAGSLLGGGDQFFQPGRSTTASAIAALPLGLWVNKRKPLRYALDWGAHRSLSSLFR